MHPLPKPAAWRDADWHLTDDTQLTLATCEAVTQEEPDPAVIAGSLLRWFRARRLTGLGASTLKALRDLNAGAHWALAGRQGEHAAGNGAAMRIAPLAFCVDPCTRDGRRLIRDVCRITHQNDEAYAGALAVVLAIRGATELSTPISLDRVAADLPDSSVRDRLAIYAGLPPQVSLADAAMRYGTSGYVVESVPFALFAAWRLNELGFAEMLNQVIIVGGDTDTNASLACQISGAALGLVGLPADLLQRLPQAELIFDVVRHFAANVARSD